MLTTRTLQGAVLDLAVVPSDSKPRVVVSALENAVLPDDRVVCALGCRGQLVAAVVVVSIFSGRRAGHVPSPGEVRGRGLASRFSGHQDAPSAWQQVQRVLPFGGLPGRERGPTLSRQTEAAVHQRRGVLPRPSVSRVTVPGAHSAAVTSTGRACRGGCGPWRLSRLCTPKR